MQREPSLTNIPRFYRRPTGTSSEDVVAVVYRLARAKQRQHMIDLVLNPADVDRCWALLREHESGSPSMTEEGRRINYDDFCQVAEEMPEAVAASFFRASHFLKFPVDRCGRIPILFFFQWMRAKNALVLN